MQKPRRPDALKNLQYKPYEFQLVGEIVILCGLIEQILKDFPILLVEAKKLSAHAFTAHLGFQSLRDLNLTLIQDYVTNEGWRKHIKETIECADKLFEHRNRIVHGPFTILFRNSGQNQVAINILGHLAIGRSRYQASTNLTHHTSNRKPGSLAGLLGCAALL